MAKKPPRRQSGLTTPQSTVQAMVNSARQKQEQQAAKLSDGRGKAGHSGQKGVDKRGATKATFYISLRAQAMLDEMKDAEETPKSDLVKAAIVALYNAWLKNPDMLEELKVHARLLNARWRLEVPDDWET